MHTTTIVIFIFIFIFIVVFIFVVVLLGLGTVVSDQGHYAHPRRDGLLERRGGNFGGEHRPHADHQEGKHDTRNERNESNAMIHGKSSKKAEKPHGLRRVRGRQYSAVPL